jgi:hypothetical protein
MNSIRPDTSASLRFYGEAEDRKPPLTGEGDSDDLHCVQTVGAVTAGVCRVVGDRMAGSWSDVNQGSRAGARKALVSGSGPKSHPEGDRASVRARKRGNARGAKGGRKSTVKRTESEQNNTGVVPERAVRARAYASLKRFNSSDPALCNGACMSESPGQRHVCVGSDRECRKA